MEKYKEKLRQFMVGRYGVDQLSLTLVWLGFILIILTLPVRIWPVRMIALIPIILCYFRTFSKKVYKRQQENFKFIRFYTPILKKYNKLLKQFKERKTHRYYKCPNCKQTLRVPKGKGNISITCPKCKNVFHKRS